MRIIPLSDQKLSASSRTANLLWNVLALFFLSTFLESMPVRADSVMALPDGSQNIMVTFDGLTSISYPWIYRGVTYTSVEGDMILWANPNMPITRFVKSPMLAITTSDELPGDPTNLIKLRLDFDQPTRFFGFSLGFNDRTQIPDGSQLPIIGSVVLEFSNGGTHILPLSASRVVCCTETRFDYSDMNDGVVGNGLVQSAMITLDYNYDPFAPGSGFPGDPFVLKFMGIDDITYSTTIVPTSMEDPIDINPGKDLPVADAGPDQTVIVPDTVQLDGSGSSDVDGDPLTYSWSITTKPVGSQAILFDPTVVRPVFVADTSGTYIVQLIVNDGKAESIPDTITIEAAAAQDNNTDGADDGFGGGGCTINTKANFDLTWLFMLFIASVVYLQNGSISSCFSGKKAA